MNDRFFNWLSGNCWWLTILGILAIELLLIAGAWFLALGSPLPGVV